MLSYALIAFVMATGSQTRWELPSTWSVNNRTLVDRIVDKEMGAVCYIVRDAKRPQITCVRVSEAIASR